MAYIATKGDALNFVAHVGADSTGATDVTALLISALQAGGRLYIPAGNYLIAYAGAALGGAYATVTKSLWVECDRDARFFSNGVERDLVRLSAPTAGAGLPSRKISVIWEGGYFDQSGQKNSTSMPYTDVYPGANVGSNATADGISVRGSYTDGNSVVHGAFDVVRIHGARFYSGAHWQTAGGDSNIYAGDGAENLDIDCWHQGSRDVSVYVSRDGTGVVGNTARVHGTFTNCFYGMAFKRGYQEFDGSGYFKNCVSGILANHVIGGQVTGGRVRGTFDGCHQAVRLDYATGITVSGCSISNMGALLADGTSVLDSTLNNPVGVLLNGTTYCSVTRNTFNAFNAAYTKTVCQGVLVDAWTDGLVGTVSSTYNDIADNVAIGLHSIGSETTGAADFNRFRFNRSLSCDLTGTVLAGTNSTEVRYDETHLADYFKSGILLPDGTSGQAGMARFGDPTTGVNFASGQIILQTGGTTGLTLSSTAVTPGHQMQGAVGTAGAPGYSFAADATTGLYRPGTGRVGLAAGAAAVLDASSTAFKPLSRVQFLASSALTATGSTQGTALALTSDVNEVATVASATGVVLPASAAGSRVTVIHADTTNYLRVYPATGEAIEGLGANVAYPVLPGERILFQCAAAGTWRVVAPRLRLLGTSGAAVSHTGDTTETALATVTVPANIMGANGCLRATYFWSGTNSVNTKTFRVRFSSITGTVFAAPTFTASASSRNQCEIHNRNATGSQVGAPNGLGSGGWSTTTGTTATASVDTTADTTLVLSGQLATGTETVQLEYYLVELIA